MKMGGYAVCADVSMVDNLQYQCMCELVSQTRQRKAEQYIFQEDKILCVAGELLLHYLLSFKHAYSPGLFELQSNARTKPCFTKKGIPDFNISHTRGFVVAIVSEQGNVGIDVENCMNEQLIDITSILRLCCSGEEQDYITAGEEDVRRRFYQVWTQKEAHFKMTGEGLSIGKMRKTSFVNDSDLLWTIQYKHYTIAVCGIKKRDLKIKFVSASEFSEVCEAVRKWHGASNRNMGC